jgi:hypothetical protein
VADLVTNAKVDTGFFLQKWREYVKVMSRTLPQAINDKLFMIARQALWRTEKADKRDIQKTLGKITYLGQKDGRKRYRHRLAKARDNDAPLIALIIQKRQRESGEKGLHGSAMRAKIQQVIGARMSSIAYIKSGWLPAIQTLAQVSSIKATAEERDDKDARQIGKPKGKASIAKAGDIIQGHIENSAWAKRDTKGAFMKYGSRGLQAGFDAEAKEMDVYIKRKIDPAAEAFNRSQR